MTFRRFRFFQITVALFTAEAVLLATSQQPTTTAPSSISSTSAHKPAGAQSPVMEEMMPMPIVAPLFIQNGTTDSEIMIVSDFSKALDVDVILSGLSGDELAKKKVTIDSHSQKKLKIADLLADAHVYRDGVYGSVSLEADRPAPFAAQLSIVDKSGPLPVDVEEEFAMLMGSKPANYRAVTSNLLEAPVENFRRTRPEGC